jgi:hypothetical protein
MEIQENAQAPPQACLCRDSNVQHYCSSSNVLQSDSDGAFMLENMDKDDSDNESSEWEEESSIELKPRRSWRRRSTQGSFNASMKRLHSERDANSAYEIMLESIDKDDSDNEMNDDTYTCK